ncbi:MAG: GNAT family N-acetyltransferase [Oscillospiraceae bacterium]|nr:GNAT family N-acetyltransferase [Oscillospiraceae bacterium]
MLIEINSFSQIQKRSLMDVYRESNMENTDFFYPDISNKSDALQKVECDFLNYIENDFLADSKNRYMVLEQAGVWVCALRLYCVDDRLYYIEALETRPDYRRKGYAAELLKSVIDLLKGQGAFVIRDCVGKKNTASLLTHQKAGFTIYRDDGFDYLQNEIDDKCYGLQFAYSL